MSSNCFPFRLMKTSNYDHHCNGQTRSVGVERDGDWYKESENINPCRTIRQFFPFNFCNFWFPWCCQVDPSHINNLHCDCNCEKEKFSAQWIHTDTNGFLFNCFLFLAINSSWSLTITKGFMLCVWFAIVMLILTRSSSFFIPISARSDEKPVAGETWVDNFFILFTT